MKCGCGSVAFDPTAAPLTAPPTTVRSTPPPQLRLPNPKLATEDVNRSSRFRAICLHYSGKLILIAKQLDFS